MPAQPALTLGWGNDIVLGGEGYDETSAGGRQPYLVCVLPMR
jgi:hypothetical protein